MSATTRTPEERVAAAAARWPQRAKMFQSAEDALQAAYDRVEAAAWMLGGVGTRYEESLETSPVDAGDVGHVYSFVESLEMQIEQLQGKQEELRRLLAALNGIRIAQEYKARAAALTRGEA